MRIEVIMSASEVAVLVANHLAKTLGIPVKPGDVDSTSYGDFKLGQYGGYHYPPRPPKPEEVIPATVEPIAEVSPPASPEAAPAEAAAPEPF